MIITRYVERREGEEKEKMRDKRRQEESREQREVARWRGGRDREGEER